MVDAGLATAPTSSTYTQGHLSRSCSARATSGGSYDTYAHTWADPVTAPAMRTAIFNRLRPGGDMPQLNGLGLGAHAHPVRAHAALEGRHQLHQRLGRRAGARGHGVAGRHGPRGARGLRRRRLLSRHRGRRAERRQPPHRRGGVLQRGVPHQPCDGHARQHQRLDGPALAGRLLRLRQQLVAGAATQRGDPAGHQQLRELGARHRQLRRHDRQVAHARLRGAAGRAARGGRALRHRVDHAADAAPQLHRHPAGTDGHGARAAAGHQLRGDLAELGHHARLRAGRRADASAARRRTTPRSPSDPPAAAASPPRGCGSSTRPARRRPRSRRRRSPCASR